MHCTASQGDYNNAIVNFKNSLYHDPKSIEAMQSLGALYFIVGDLTMGRHYLGRAIEIVEARDGEAIRRGGGEDCYHWLLDYLVSSFSLNPSWREEEVLSNSLADDENDTVETKSIQTSKDFACLEYFVRDDDGFTPRMHYELGLTLWELGAWELARKHMGEYGVNLLEGRRHVKNDVEVKDGFLFLMKVRLSLDFPLVVESCNQRSDLWQILRKNLHKMLLLSSSSSVSPPIDEIQDALVPLPSFHFHKDKNTSENMRKTFEMLRMVQPELKFVAQHLIANGKDHELPKRKNHRIRVGVVGQYFCAHQVGRITLPLITR